MYLLKKITIYLFAIIFILTTTLSNEHARILGAKTGSTDPESIPVYEETDIGKIAGINQPGRIIRLNSKQQLVVYDIYAEKGKTKYRYVTLSPEGKLLTEISPDFTGDGSIFALDPKDNLYVLAQEYVMDKKTKRPQEIRRKLSAYNPQGKKLETVDLGKTVPKDDQIPFVQDMAIDSKGVVYLAIHNEGLSVLEKNMKRPKTLRSGRDYYSIAVDAGDNLIAQGYDSNSRTSFLEKLKPTTGEPIWKTNLEISNWIDRIFYHMSDNSIYALGTKRIEKYDASGKFSGAIFDFTQQDLIGDEIQVNCLAVDQLNNIFMAITYPKESKARVKKYTPDADAKVKNQKTLTIAVMIASGNFLENARSIFQKSHPGWTVNIKEYLSGQDIEGYQKTLNTEILAGKGADLIEVGFLPYLNYCEKNIFVDLNDFIVKEKDLDLSKYDINSMKACEYEGKLYVASINFGLYILYANQTLLDQAGIKIDDRRWSWQDFLDIAVKVTKDTDNDGIVDQYALPKMDERELFKEMFRSSSGRFIDYEQKKARFDSQEFQEFLSLCKTIIAKKVINPQVDEEKFYNGQGRGSIVFIPYLMSQYIDPVAYRELRFHDKVRLLSRPGASSKGISVYGDMYAINRHSPYQKEAWEFIKIMLSDELQSSQGNLCFPINLTARQTKAEIVMTYTDNANINGKKISQWLTKEELGQINGLLGRIGDHTYRDSQLSLIINTEVAKFFNGEKTAQEVGKAIQNKVYTYLNE